MQNLDEKKADTTEMIDYNDLCFSDWENFTEDIDFASLEQSLEMTESNTETFDEKIINVLSDGKYCTHKRCDIELDSPTCKRVETLQDDSFAAQIRKCIPSRPPFTVYLRREPRTDDLPRKIDSYVSNAATRNIFSPYEKISSLDAEKTFSSLDDLQLKCTGRDQRHITQEYTNRNVKSIFFEENCGSRLQNEENQKYFDILPHASRLKVFDIYENDVSTLDPEMIASSAMTTGKQNNFSNEKNTSCKNISSLKENYYDSERIIFLGEENFDSQKMIISSQESLDDQRMIISSQETFDSQKMITSSQESSGTENMIISSQEFSDSQKMITSSQEFSDSQKMITSSQEFSDSQKMITSSQDISDSQKMIVSSQDSLNGQRIIFSQESFCSQKIISSQSVDTENILYQVSKDLKAIPSCKETSVRQKLFNSRSGSFLKTSKNINLKTGNKSYPSLGSQVSLKDKKMHKFLDFKRLARVTNTVQRQRRSSPSKYDNVQRKIIHIGELKVRKIEIGMNK